MQQTSIEPVLHAATASRILIAGGPRVGKTFLAGKLGVELGIIARHTDDLIASFDWSAASLEASSWMEDAGPFIIEGVATVRAARKWLERNPAGAPADVLYWGRTPREPLSKGQAAMAKGCETVWKQIRDELVARGVRIEEF